MEDGLSGREHDGVTLLQELARVSDKAFEHLLELGWPRQPVKLGTAILTFEILVKMAKTNEDAVIQIASMPILETVEYIDMPVVVRLSELAVKNPKALNAILSHPITETGITDEKVFQVLLLYLDETPPSTATAIRSLPWVQDGITYVPPQERTNPDAQPREFEPYFVMYMIDFATLGSDFLLEFVKKPWIQDGPDQIERNVVRHLYYLVSRNAEAALRVLRLPLLETIEETDAHYVESLADLAAKNRRGLEEALARLANADG